MAKEPLRGYPWTCRSIASYFDDLFQFRHWTGTSSEGAKFGMSVLTDKKNRAVREVFFRGCYGLKCLPEVVGNVWPLAPVQSSIIPLIRNKFKHGSKSWDALKRDVKPISIAPLARSCSRPWMS